VETQRNWQLKSKAHFGTKLQQTLPSTHANSSNSYVLDD